MKTLAKEQGLYNNMIALLCDNMIECQICDGNDFTVSVTILNNLLTWNTKFIQKILFNYL